jgi:acetolactate synthase-1/3 small subunit
MTFVIRGDDRVLEQVRKQLEKVVTVVQVHDISSEAFVERDLMLVKVEAPSERRGELKNLIDIFRGRIVDVSRTAMMIEISGTEEKVEAFVDVLRPYGIIELARTGRIAMVRSSVDRREKTTK